MQVRPGSEQVGHVVLRAWRDPNAPRQLCRTMPVYSAPVFLWRNCACVRMLLRCETKGVDNSKFCGQIASASVYPSHCAAFSARVSSATMLALYQRPCAMILCVGAPSPPAPCAPAGRIAPRASPHRRL